MSQAIIFDFDGVIADSEVRSNTTLAEIVTELGVPTTLDDAYRDCMGKRFHEAITAIEQSDQRFVGYICRAAPDTRMLVPGSEVISARSRSSSVTSMGSPWSRSAS